MARGRKLGKETGARLPEDLIVEILLKLPVKSLLRFRCVCKSWCDLIKSSNFIHMHLKHQYSTKSDLLVIRSLKDQQKHLLSLHSYESLSVICSEYLQIPQFDYRCIKVCGPCNGLLCISDNRNIVLCNPAMREFKVLPPRHYKNHRALGLGFDSNTNDYKVVAIVRDRDNFMFGAEIYYLSTNSWKQVELDQDLSHKSRISYNPVYGTLFNGAFHWIARRKGIHFILSFDMSTEVFRQMELPEVKGEISKSLTVLNESLALFACTWPSYNSEQNVDIWIMHEYGVAKTWTKQFSILAWARTYRPILLWKNAVIFIECSGGQLVSCSLDTPEMKDFGIHGERGRFEVMVYQESLVSIR